MSVQPTNQPVIAITGASSGIGLATAQHLARAGARVVLSARRGDRLEQEAGAIRAAGGQAIAVPGDVTDELATQALVARALESFGRLDVMVANAGAGYHGTLADTPADVARRLMDVNYMGTFLAAQAALPAFTQQGAGHLVIVSSIVGRRGIAGMSAYGATKAAQLGFAEALRTELSGTGVHVSVVFPISTRTEFHDAMERDFGHSVTGLGPRQESSRVAEAIAAVIRRPRAEVYPHRLSRALAVLGVMAPTFTDRVVRRYGRRRQART